MAELKDSGDRTVFASGAVRDCRIGKGMPCLVPIHPLYCMLLNANKTWVDIPPEPMFRIEQHFEKGRVKYSDANNYNLWEENWKKGIVVMAYYDSASRHLNEWLMKDESEDKLAAAFWNVVCLMETERRINLGILETSLDNRDYNEFNETRTREENPEKFLYPEPTPHIVNRVGMPYSNYYNEIKESLMDWKRANQVCNYLSLALWEILALMETERRVKLGVASPKLDDRDPMFFIQA